MIKILYTLPALDGGGAEKIIYDYIIRMSKDICCDFIVHTSYKGILEDSLEKRGSKIFHVAPLRDGIISYMSNIKKIIKNGEYNIIHVNQGYKGIAFLAIAKLYGINIRIAHSHMAGIPENLFESFERYICRSIAKFLSTDLFACGNDAASWMWGWRTFKKGKVHIMTNAIPFDHFKFSQENRDRIREELGIKNSLVVGNVARFSYQKNHDFLIKIFNDLLNIQENSVLLLVGRGELENDIHQLVNGYNLNDRVLFLGVRNDVPLLMNAMDIFLLPSRFEGLPVTLVEAQANGLPCLVSDSITKEIKISDRIEFYSLQDNSHLWAKKICEMYKRQANRKMIQVSENYNIDVSYKKIEEFYRERVCKS